MNFFKSAKYKMGGGGSKSKGETKQEQPEHFHKIETPASLDKGKPTKSKAPQKPSDKKASSDDVTFCFRISNQTPFPWKLKETQAKSVFPTEVSVNDGLLVRFDMGQPASQATYTIEVESKKGETTTCDIQLKLACNDNTYELIVDWMSLAEVEGFQLKPDSTSSNQPIKLSKDEIIIEAEYKK